MSNKMLSTAGVNDNRESTKVDKIGTYLDQLFDPNQEPTGMFLYDRGNPLTQDNGAYEFSQVLRSQKYSELSSTEATLYKNNKELITYYFDGKHVRNVIDMGCGDGQKSSAILTDVLGERLKGKTYIPADISPYFVDHASAQMKSLMQEKQRPIKVTGTKIDFLSDDTLKDIKNKMYFFLGGSIGNFSDAQIIQLLKNMSSDTAFGRKNNIVLSYFTAPDPAHETYHDDIKKMLAAYGDPDKTNPYHDANTTGHTKKRVLDGFQSLGIPLDSIEFTVQYDDQHNRVLSGAKVKKSFTIQHAGKNYTKQEGEYLRAIQSRRFTTDKMRTLAEAAGTHMRNPSEEDGMAMAILEASRSPEAKEKIRLMKKAALVVASSAILLTGALTAGMELQKKKQKEKEKKEFVKEMAPWMNQFGEMRGMYTLGKSGESDVEMMWNSYEYQRNRMKMIYGIDDDKAEAMRRSFLSRLIKAQAHGKYSVPGRFGGGESFIHKLNDFVAERGDDYGLSTKDYFGYLDLDDEAMQNTLNSNKEEPKTKELHVIKEQIINNDFYMDVFDNEYSTLGKVGTALINGKRYIVASHILNNQHDTLSVETGKQFLDIYYMNTPGLFAFSQQIAERLKINAGNMWVAYGRSGNKYQESAQVQIQTKIASLLAQGYKFDFYQLNATDNEYELAFFAQTFLELPDSAYKDAEISNREYFKEHNVAPLLDTSIRLIKERHINKHPLTIKQENQLKSMIFHKIYLNGTYRGLTAENVLEELHDEIDKELNPPPLPGTRNPGETARNVAGGYHGMR